MAFIYNLSDTWNAGATVFTAIKMNVTDTASATGSKLIDLQINGTTRFDVDKNGQVEISAGTALLPSLSTLGDTNTGMWFPAADTIAWSTAGSEKMRILSTGEVGIGTSTPGSFGKLEVLGSGYTAFSVASSDASGVRVVLAANAASEARINVTSNHPLVTFVNGAERMRVTAAGNVGIGTTAPGHLLQINSTGAAISATTSSTTTQFTGPGLRLYNTNASMGTQAGIGIASLILDASATQGYMTFFQTNNSGGFVRDILRYDYNASLWQFYTNATEKLRIDTNGNVGIGTSTFGTSAVRSLAIGTGTAPTTGPADTIQIYSTDLSAGNTMLSLFTEGTVVNANTTAAATHRIAIRVNGTVYYLLANTAA